MQGLAYSKCLIYSSCYYHGDSENSNGDEFLKIKVPSSSKFMRSFMRGVVAPSRGHYLELQGSVAVQTEWLGAKLGYKVRLWI